MSGLSLLSTYGTDSTSEESDSEQQIKNKLPVPDLSKVGVTTTEEHIDDVLLYSGRIRTFPHVRGNWATFVYVKYPAEQTLNKLIKKLQKITFSVNEPLEVCENLHISLSRTVVLKYHFISEFIKSLQKALEDLDSFELGFESVKIYCNEEKTRTFVALKVDYFTHKYLLKAVQKIDEILLDFKLPTFYNDPSFHMSILWMNGDKKAELQNFLEALNSIVSKKVENSVTISQVICKSGNRQYQYFLK